MPTDKKERKRLLQTYGSLYHKHFVEEPGCFYCGDDHEAWDHCPPISWVESRRMKDWRAQKIPFVLLPVCRACNDALGGKPYMTALDRLLFLETKLTNTMEKGLALWSEEEIEEMSPTFQRQIRAKQQKLQLMAARIHGIQKRILDTHSHPEYPVL